MTDVADLAEAFKREVAVPGAFAVAFPSMQQNDIVGSLMDAFSEAQLDGFFHTMELDVDGASIAPDLSNAGGALVVIYAGIRLLRHQIRIAGASATYKAGPVEFSTQNSATASVELLKQLERRRDQLLENARRGTGTSVFQIEGYAARGSAYDYYGGFFPYESALPTWRL